MTSTQGTVLVTGGSRGIGAHVVRLLARDGYDVGFTYRARSDAAEAVIREVQAAGGRAWAVRADMAESDAPAHVLAQMPANAPPLVGLVNNAGITGPLGTFADTDLATLRRVLEVNVLGLYAMTQAVVRRWLAQGQPGVIVNVSSAAATLGSPGEYVHYAASKAAVETFTLGLGKELAPQGIRVNCVSPGTSLTDIHATAGDANRPARVATKIPMGRAGDPQEIAEAIAWLLSPRASYVTGTVLRVAGGS